MRQRKLAGTVVAITGGARGIGLATAQQFIARGARVAIGDVDADLVQQSAQKMGALGVAIDVRDLASMRSFVAQVNKELGPVEVFVNNAGIMPAGGFLEESAELSDTQIDINLRGVIHGCRAALPDMLAHANGHIVNVASMAGVLPIPGLAVYCATKFAVMGLTQSLREEYRDQGIRFSSIMPAKVTTELAAGSDEAAKALPTSSPDDVANAIVGAVLDARTDVTVPSYLAMTSPLLSAIPHRVERGFRRLLGDRRVLEQLNAKQRANYNDRINSLAKR